MKSIKILLLALVALCATSCIEGFEDTGFTPQDPDISFKVESVTISNEAQETTIIMSSNLPWMLSSDATWLSVSPTRGEGGEEISITIKAQRNRTVEARVATLTARIVDDATCSMEVVQAAAQAGSTTIYYAKVDGSKENSGLSWSNATTLSNAIYMAGDGDIIYVAEGTYTPEDYVSGYDGEDGGYKTFELHSNFSLIGGFAADVNDDTFDAENDYAPSAYVVTLSGAIDHNTNAYHVVTVSAIQAEGKKVVLKGVTICDGVSSEDGDTTYSSGSAVAHISRGAGMVIGKSTIDMADCIITDNASNEHAGGIMALAGGVISMENCHIRNNTCVSNAGGVWNSGATFYMNNCTFDNNRSGSQAGAYYSIEEKSTTTSVSRIYNTSFTNNNNKFKSASGRTGGAIYFRAWTNAVMVNCTVSGNESSGNGGGIEVHGASGKTSEVVIINSTISDNDATLNGGGIGVYNKYTSLKLYNTIVSGNTCNTATEIEVGRGVADELAIYFYNSIVGSSLYGAEGTTSAGASFDAGSMLSELGKWSGSFNDTYSYQLIYGENNPACSGGKSVEEITNIALELSPAVDVSMLTIDQRGVARGDKRAIGANTYDN